MRLMLIVLLVSLATVFFSTGCTDKKAAEAAFQRALDYNEQGQYALAEKELDTAISVDAENKQYVAVRARTYLLQQKYDDAIQGYTRALELYDKEQNPSTLEIIGCRLGRADAYIGKGEGAKGIVEYQAVADANPEIRGINNRPAWKLATSPDPSIRNGKLAVTYAQRAYAEKTPPRAYVIDTLAAAYAEAGDFAEAVRRQQEAITQLSPTDDRADYESRLRLYQAGQPYHESR